MSKHSIRTGSTSRLSCSRSSSSASMRRARVRSRMSVSCSSASVGVARREVGQAPLLAAAGRPHLDGRAAALPEERLQQVGVLERRGTTTCPGIATWPP